MRSLLLTSRHAAPGKTAVRRTSKPSLATPTPPLSTHLRVTVVQTNQILRHGPQPDTELKLLDTAGVEVPLISASCLSRCRARRLACPTAGNYRTAGETFVVLVKLTVP
jgi:hypothetical protein